MAEGVRLRDLAVERSWQEAAGQASSMIAWFCFQLGEAEIGIEHAFAAKNFWAEVGNGEREAWTGAVYAWLLLEAGLAEDAADEAVKALSLAEQSGHDITISWAMNVLGVIFWGCKQLERAEILCERAVKIARVSGDATLLSWWLINIGGVHSDIGLRKQAEGDATATDSLQLALSLNHEALTLAQSLGDDWCLRIALANSAEYMMALGELTGAVRVLDEWEALPSKAGSRNVGQFLYTKGQLLIKQSRLTEALAICASALALAEAKHNADGEAYALRYLSQIYEGLGRFDSALAYFKRFYDAQSRVAAEKTQRRARLAEIHYETERFKRLAETASQRADAMTLTSMLDPLTGLGNRRQLDQAMATIRAGTSMFAIAVVDLDHFKGINDRYSHMVGDEVLKRVAGVLQSSVRKGDVVVRLGGEEFVIVMYDIDMWTATERCVALNEKIKTSAWAEIEPNLHVTASMGVAAGECDSNPATIFALADHRLYRAKAAGRDCVVGAPEDCSADPCEAASVPDRIEAGACRALPAGLQGIDVIDALRRLSA